MSIKISISLEIRSTIDHLISDCLHLYVANKPFVSSSVIVGQYIDEETNIPFSIPNCQISFKDKKITSINLPEIINFESEKIEALELASKIETANILFPFDLIRFVGKAQLANIEKIISNNIEALNLAGLNEEALIALSDILGFKHKPLITFSDFTEDTESYRAQVNIQIGKLTFTNTLRHSKEKITPYQTLFTSEWKADGETPTTVLEWVKSNYPESLFSTDNLDRPLSSLHYMFKEFISNKKTAQ